MPNNVSLTGVRTSEERGQAMRRCRRVALASALVLACTLHGCSTKTTAPAVPQPPLPPVPPWVAQGLTPFGFALLNEVWKEPHGPNVLLSPASLGLGMAMTANGANGPTYSAIVETLQLDSNSLDDINGALRALRNSLSTPGAAVQLDIANVLWVNQGLELQADFLERNTKSYHAEVQSLDLRSPQAAGRMNAWVSQATHERIRGIVRGPFKPEASLFLLGAVYFKAPWQYRFKANETEDGAFTTADGTKRAVKLMTQKGQFAYFAGREVQAIALPFEGERFDFLVFLPDERSSLTDFLKTLTPENWRQWQKNLNPTEVNIRLPRFAIEFNARLNDALNALGMGLPLTQQADFGSMLSGNIAGPTWIGEVRHGTFLEVNEEGAEAAVATSHAMNTTGTGGYMEVTRPFFCAIRDRRTSVLLFVGAIGDPTASGP